VLEKDPKELERILKQMREKQKNLSSKMKSSKAYQGNTVHNNHKELMSDSDEDQLGQDDVKNDKGIEIKITTSKSSSSCDIDEIQYVNFGGFSSRFWAMRKHTCCMKQEHHGSKFMPFFSWQCISMRLKHREIDFVIKNEKQQNNLVKFLIHKLGTVDGRVGSAEGILKALNE
tara:strand:- start:563 stop:1081 length:519 start_codon:yes stop_codon:yes gene_type:complete